jgi:hypothetical protein
MQTKQSRVKRQGQIYRFVIAETEYAVFVWQMGLRFRGRVEGNPQVPEQSGRTALAVRDALQQQLIIQNAAK